jgi:hypothetical protein
LVVFLFVVTSGFNFAKLTSDYLFSFLLSVYHVSICPEECSKIFVPSAKVLCTEPSGNIDSSSPFGWIVLNVPFLCVISLEPSL